MIAYGTTPSPIGALLLVADDDALIGLYVDEHERSPRPAGDWCPDDGRLDAVRQQLAEYFDGSRTCFELPVRPDGTAFQQRVWSALKDIPYGTTTSYGRLARELGHPTASRAVGAANGQNPVSVILPCHRVVGARGALIGYGWGVERKAWLLRHEGAA